jgi:hypothetical protein
MIWLPRSVVLAGLLLPLGLPSRAADNGPAHFDPNALLGSEGSGGTLPISTSPNGGAPPPDLGSGGTLPISTGPNGGAPPPSGPPPIPPAG